jgi:hypothetical protein
MTPAVEATLCILQELLEHCWPLVPGKDGAGPV